MWSFYEGVKLSYIKYSLLHPRLAPHFVDANIMVEIEERVLIRHYYVDILGVIPRRINVRTVFNVVYS